MNVNALRRRRRLAASGLTIVAMLVAGCGSSGGGARGGSGGGSRDLHVGAVQPLTGPLAALGQDSLLGMSVAVNLVNKDGGVDGRHVTLDVADAPSVQDARSRVEQLVRNKGDAVVTGTYGSSQAIEAATTATRFGAFYFEVNSASTDITTRSAPYSLKVPWTIPDLTERVPTFLKAFFAPQLHKDPSQLRVGLLYEDTAYGTGVEQLLGPALAQAGLGKLVVSESYTAATVQDFTPAINRLKAAHVDVLLAASYLNDAELFLRQAAQSHLQIPDVVGMTAGFADPSLARSIPARDLDGVYVIDSNPELRAGLTPSGLRLRDAFLAGYAAKRPGIPVSHAAYAFTGMYVLLHDLLPGVDVTARGAILRKGMSLDVPLGSLPMGFGIKFDGLDSRTHPHINTRSVILVNQWQHGRIVPLAPRQFADGQPMRWTPGS